jgi:hypothetical protein
VQIILNIYEGGFEPQADFLQNNFVRFFSPDYLLDALNVKVPSLAAASDSINFMHIGVDFLISFKLLLVVIQFKKQCQKTFCDAFYNECRI